ncbi:uncharacterized protein LOC106130382 [Amyelois transitella]|uniref:uncharacterized protein LOC106130382 n=1 Tax=Amyelois transitella TaxID=680683 RepID=UPI00298F6BB0|nr:uncharacterized protein LOC106130382 [Amyelois transitella]
MKSLLYITCLLATVLSSNVKLNKETFFKNAHLVFSSKFNITQVMVPVESTHYIPSDVKDKPSIFFTVSDPTTDKGSCIYILEGFAAYEVLEGGRDTTADYGQDNTVYFGARDGIYKYVPDSFGVQKFGSFDDDIIQLQKAKGQDVIYFLNTEHKLYKIENNGTLRTRIKDVICAHEFVLDTSNNIYYLACEDRLPRILRTDGSLLGVVSSLLENDIRDIKLIRPAFLMEDSIPFFGDNALYILYSNGTSDRKDFQLEERPSAVSVDSTLYIVVAINGKIYEFDVMDMLLGSMFGFTSSWPADIAKIVMAFIETTKVHLGYVNNHKLNVVLPPQLADA